MEIRGRTVLILGGSGLVGTAVARRILRHEPRTLVVGALTQREADATVEELRGEDSVDGGTELVAVGGDIFLPAALKDRPVAEVIADPAARAQFLDHLYGGPAGDPVAASALGAILLEHEPEIIVDCIDTARAISLDDTFAGAARLRDSTRDGDVGADQVECFLASLQLPRLIRHVRIAYEGMRRIGTRVYVKIGSSGTDGLGLNTPFAGSEERPLDALLAESGTAGAHTLFLFLLARTPGGPAVKEIKPTAAVGWKRIAFGEVEIAGRIMERIDAARHIPLAEAFGPEAEDAWTPAGGVLEGVFLDAGRNGLFSLGEFEALTSLGLMELVTPEEIAVNVEREILGHATGKDVIAALDAASSGPSYRGGVLREAAIERMEAIEHNRRIYAVAYERLGPPRLTKLLFEAAILDRLFPDLRSAAELDPADTAIAAAALIAEDSELRIRALSAGIPILLPDGRHLLRGQRLRVAPAPGQSHDDPRLPEEGWIDLTAENWRRWGERIREISAEMEALPGLDGGSRRDLEPPSRANDIRPGRLAAWVLGREDQGERKKR